MTTTAEPGAAHALDTLARWRTLEWPQRDPLRFAVLEALARRAQAHQGAVRALLDARLAGLMAQFEALQAVPLAQPVQAAPSTVPPRGPLGTLADSVGQPHAPAASPGPRPVGEAAVVAAPAASPHELRTLRRFRGTWKRLAAEARLHQTLAQVPSQAGPINSHHLVHRALVLMREVSPDYLQHFVAHADTLLWLEQAQAAAVAPPPARLDGRRKGSGRGR